MTNLPSLYARVVAKRPDLAVETLEYHDDQGVAFWTLDLHGLELEDDDPAEAWKDEDETTKGACSILPNQAAAALILARWVDGLPEAAWLGRPTTPVHGWRVCYRNDRSETTSYDLVRFSPIEPSPIEALAAFYLGEA